MCRNRAVLFLILVLPLPAIAAEWTGKVVAITDGDTIRVLHEGRQVKIRLQGIDCPEKGQAFGAKAKQATSDLAFGKSVTVKEKEKDRYGRTVAEVILPDGSSLNRELVRAGFAWWYQKYSKDKSLGELEAEARKAKRGLWADTHPVPPWDWRESERERKTQTKRRPVEPLPTPSAGASLERLQAAESTPAIHYRQIAPLGNAHQVQAVMHHIAEELLGPALAVPLNRAPVDRRWNPQTFASRNTQW